MSETNWRGPKRHPSQSVGKTKRLSNGVGAGAATLLALVGTTLLFVSPASAATKKAIALPDYTSSGSVVCASASGNGYTQAVFNVNGTNFTPNTTLVYSVQDSTSTLGSASATTDAKGDFTLSNATITASGNKFQSGSHGYSDGIGPSADVQLVSGGINLSGSCATATAPTAAFTDTVNHLSVNFDSSGSSGTKPLSYSWNFGDGTTSTSANPTHAYATAGTYSVDLTVTNSAGHDSVTHKVTVAAAPVNHAPVANDDAATTTQGKAVTIDVLANDTDVDGNKLHIDSSSLTQPAHGTVTISNEEVVYTPASGFAGADSFTYKANDGKVDSYDAATVSVTVVKSITPPPPVVKKTVHVALQVSRPSCPSGKEVVTISGDTDKVNVVATLSRRTEGETVSLPATLEPGNVLMVTATVKDPATQQFPNGKSSTTITVKDSFQLSTCKTKAPTGPTSTPTQPAPPTTNPGGPASPGAGQVVTGVSGDPTNWGLLIHGTGVVFLGLAAGIGFIVFRRRSRVRA